MLLCLTDVTGVCGAVLLCLTDVTGVCGAVPD